MFDSFKIRIIRVLETNAHSLIARLRLLTTVKVLGHLALAVGDRIESCRFVDCLVIQKVAVVLGLFGWASTVRNLANLV